MMSQGSLILAASDNTYYVRTPVLILRGSVTFQSRYVKVMTVGYLKVMTGGFYSCVSSSLLGSRRAAADSCLRGMNLRQRVKQTRHRSSGGCPFRGGSMATLLADFACLVLPRRRSAHQSDCSDNGQSSKYELSCKDLSGYSPAKNHKLTIIS